MAAGFDITDDPISGINVTPLVDVVLVLLVIFLITAPVLYQSAIKVQLPKATTGEEAKHTSFSFSLTKEGQLSWDKQPIGWEALDKRLTAMSATAASETALISADQATPHGMVIRLMDALRRAGLTHFGLTVDSSRPPSPAH